MKNRNSFFVSILIVLIVVLILIYLLSKFLFLNVLTLEKSSDGEIIFQEQINLGERFLLKYTHSVAKTPVWEFFEINKKGDLVLVETHFLDHGAGLPYAAFDNEFFVNEDNRFKIKNMSRKISLPLYYRIGKIRENYFVFKKNEIDLSKRAGDSVLLVNVLKMNLLNYLNVKYLN